MRQVTHLLPMLLLALSPLIYSCTVTGTESIKIVLLPLTQGNKAVLCFTLTAYDASNATQTKYWAFRAEIDRFSSFQLTGAAAFLSGMSATNATVLVQFQNQASGLTILVLDTSLDLKKDFSSVVVNTI